MPNSLTAIILTFNEERHIERCIRSLAGVAERICVVDSFSTDKTVEVALRLGAEVHQNAWSGHAAQLQWALDNLGTQSTWTIRIDADEYLSKELQSEISERLPRLRDETGGVLLRRQIVFLHRPIKWGFFYPLKILRIWRTGQASVEQRLVDEHLTLVQPATETFASDLVDHNLNDLSWWIAKHDKYATLESYEYVRLISTKFDKPRLSLAGTAKVKRFIKNQMYYRIPAAARPTFYFLYRYIAGLGFMDGREGLFFHFMQAYWYRTLVEAKVLEIKQQAIQRGITPYRLLVEKGLITD